MPDVGRIATHFDGQADFADQIARMRADDAAADDQHPWRQLPQLQRTDRVDDARFVGRAC